ncbi:TetR family transcriptional regulator [Methylosinus sporium]|uniref:TetR/AcrR family transcriptional regulator n=1 Tax=Methylosinus sporium TaxID=428 RepID=UPI00383BA170
MRAKRKESRGGEKTRERILQAALVRFGSASYEDVKLRDIAAEVGVDVALVHRAFGSKEQLFAAALTASGERERQIVAEGRSLGAQYAEDLFRERENETLQIVVRSMTNPQAREVLRALSLPEFVGPIAATLDGPAALERATLFSACLFGISILRHVLGVEALQNADEATMRPLIERVLAACLAPESAVEEGAAQRASGPPALEARPQKKAAARGAPKRSVARK